MISVKLQYNKSDAIVMRKTIEDVITYSGILKEETGIINPVIVFEINGSFPNNVNYATISEFGRSYFIGEPTSIRNGLWEVPMHCDVLSSFESQLVECDCILNRSESDYNLYLPDKVIEIPAHKTTRIVFPNAPQGGDIALTAI